LLALNPFNFEAYLQRGRAHERLKQPQQAIADYSLALILMPPQDQRRAELLLRRAMHYVDSQDLAAAFTDVQQMESMEVDKSAGLHDDLATLYNNLAWALVTVPEQERNAARALSWAQKAVERMPEQGTFWNTLGVVYYRLGQYAKARDSLDRSLSASKGQYAAYDLFFLAMCHARQGDAVQAKDYYDRAVRWVQEKQGQLQPSAKEELEVFRAEAEAALLKDTKP
jgi:tetratricopeptide (TPR) repeat protein